MDCGRGTVATEVLAARNPELNRMRRATCRAGCRYEAPIVLGRLEEGSDMARITLGAESCCPPPIRCQ